MAQGDRRVLPGVNPYAVVSGARPAGERAPPLWIVCEDGDEYFDRFSRFLGAEFRFGRATGAESLCEALAHGADGVILDLDFSRAPAGGLVGPPGEDRLRLAAEQGIHILRHLREHGFLAPVLLFADLADAAQIAYLGEAFAPVAVVPSHEGLAQIAARMRGR